VHETPADLAVLQSLLDRSYDVHDASERGFRQTLLDIYVPRYGPEWEQFLDSGPVYARIDADRMFTFFMASEDA
jgi:hypothetical protein